MHTIKMRGLVGEDKKLSLTLPPGVPAGMVEVIILVDEPEDRSFIPSNDLFAELMTFHKGHRLDGVSLKELAAEGRH